MQDDTNGPIASSESESSSSSDINLEDLGWQYIAPGILRIDVRTSVREFLLYISLMACLFVVGTLLYSGIYSIPVYVVSVFYMGIIIGPMLLNDEYYVVDINKHRFFKYSIMYGFIKAKHPWGAFNDIVAFTTTSFLRRKKSKNACKNVLEDSGMSPPWWEYAVVAVSKDGLLIPFTTFKRDALDECNRTAERLAKLTNTQFVMGLPQCVPAFSKDGEGKLVITQKGISEIFMGWLRNFFRPRPRW